MGAYEVLYKEIHGLYLNMGSCRLFVLFVDKDWFNDHHRWLQVFILLVTVDKLSLNSKCTYYITATSQRNEEQYASSHLLVISNKSRVMEKLKIREQIELRYSQSACWYGTQYGTSRRFRAGTIASFSPQLYFICRAWFVILYCWNFHKCICETFCTFKVSSSFQVYLRGILHLDCKHCWWSNISCESGDWCKNIWDFWIEQTIDEW